MLMTGSTGTLSDQLNQCIKQSICKIRFYFCTVKLLWYDNSNMHYVGETRYDSLFLMIP